MEGIFKIILIINSVYCVIGIDPVVLTSLGAIKGLNSDNGEYAMFLGIPYAVVNKEAPFNDASPHPGFENAFEANDDSVVCPQYINDNIIGEIDCLQLNVYVPNIADSKHPLPVMVYLPGGSFITGSKKRENFDPTFLVKHDVIVVVINYRLGPYGFLCLSSPEFNNQGMKDQILAMKWVKENINDFGGDANKVTIFGQSAGAMTLDVLLLVLEEKLFARVIIQSGTAINPWVITTENNSIPLRISQYLGFDGENVTSAMEYLSNMNAVDVIKAADELSITNLRGHPLTKPCVHENDINPFLEEYPLNVNPKVKNMDIMIGHTNKEVMFLYPNDDEGKYYTNYKFGDELLSGFNEVNDEDIVKHFYVGDRPTNQNEINTILDYGSDFAFVYPVERSIKRYLDNGAHKVYRYMFTYEGERNRLKISRNLTSEGASHGDDIGYLFDLPVFTEAPTDKDQNIIDVMTKMWTDFAKYGDPTPTTSDLIPMQWEPVTDDIQHYMHIDLPLVAGKRPFNERMAFWELYYRINEKAEKGYKEKDTTN